MVVTKDSGLIDEGLICVPQNRTLYVDQFTSEAPLKPAILWPDDLNYVFEILKPKASIALEDEEGNEVLESFAFKSINDFEDESLINQSKILQTEKKVLKKNLSKVHQEIKRLEITYRTLGSFFDNVESGAFKDIVLMNVDRDQLVDCESRDFEGVRDELTRHYDSLSLKANYSLLVVPGIIGDAPVIMMWARMAYLCKVVLLTDFDDAEDFCSLRARLESANFQGEDIQLANVVMTCNRLLGRSKSEIAGEESDLFIPGSAAVAGRMTRTDEIAIVQGIAGKEFGILNKVKGTRIHLSETEIAELVDLGVVPINEEGGQAIVCSSQSLYSGTISGLQEYPVIRLLDWIHKVLVNFIYLKTDFCFTISPLTIIELNKGIHDFLSDCQSDGSNKLIEDFIIEKIDLDRRVYDLTIQIRLKPQHSHYNYVLEMTVPRDPYRYISSIPIIQSCIKLGARVNKLD